MSTKKQASKAKAKAPAKKAAKKGSSDKSTARKNGASEKEGQKDIDKAQLATLAEVAKMLRLSPLQVKKMAQTGQIPAVKVEGQWRFNKDLVYQAIKNRSLGR